MAWTETSGSAATYALPAAGTDWDSDETLWDLRGNVEATYWDRPGANWGEAARNSTNWNEA